VAWAEDLARGLHAACERHGADVVGGDLSGGDRLVVAVTVHGDLEGRPAVLRSGARAGDVVAHAGVRGWSAGGLALLTGATDPARVAHGEQLVRGFLRPEPPVALGAVAATAGATALMDVSDGLLRDAGRLARASRVTLDLDEPLESFAEDAAVLAPAARLLGQDVRRWLLAGGEDHGLLATFPAEVSLPTGYRAVGVVREAGDQPVLVAGRPAAVEAPGWDHFADVSRGGSGPR
jgi:thiamine-monophosphate kinase